MDGFLQALTEMMIPYGGKVLVALMVLFVGWMFAGCVNWSVRLWAKSDDFLAVKQAATRAVKLALDEANIEIPFPQMDVHVSR